jgi:hypothetical protein
MCCSKCSVPAVVPAKEAVAKRQTAFDDDDGKSVVPAIGRNDFPRRREPIPLISRGGMDSRLHGNDGF